MLDRSSSPPPTPGPSSFATALVHNALSTREQSRSLSLQIPDHGLAFGGLTIPAQPSAHPGLSSPSHSGQSDLDEPHHAHDLSLPRPLQPKPGRRRPSRLNLAPPSLSDEPGLSSRSMPTSPAVLSRSNSQIGPLDSQERKPSISEAVKDLSSTLRGTPRRRPSMPFKRAQTTTDADQLDPGSSKSIRSRPPEAFRDPSEHILSGKGSTLQHARSVYSQGPVEILPGLFLGDEHNACDNEMLSDLGITTILNVAKETVLPFQLERDHVSHSATTKKDSWSQNTIRAVSGARVASVALASKEQDDFEHFFTPPTTAFPSAADLKRREASEQADSPAQVISPTILRNTSSTPNLLTQFFNGEGSVSTPADDRVGFSFDQEVESPPDDLPAMTAQDVLRYRTLRRQSSSSSDDPFDTASSPSSSRAPSTCTSAATELTPPALMGLKPRDHAAASESSSSISKQTSSGQISNGVRQSSSTFMPWLTQVELPSNATAIKVPASPISARMDDIRYIKLPWTHDETDLAASDGGFTQGCALIAEALGLDYRVWVASQISQDPSACSLLSDDHGLDKIRTSRPGKILVHCQCGVSRSATLVIAFVMQAAAMRYGFEETQSLMGMHDCYNLVKEKSASISPNISLIYQLVEWERHLSNAASRLRDVLGMGRNDPEGYAAGSDEAHTVCGTSGVGWSTETMDEAMWSKMRLEEEEKEAEEEARRREERLSEAKRLAAERKAAEDRLEGRQLSTFEEGESSMGSLMQRRRRKAAPALQLQAKPVAEEPPPVPPKSPNMLAKRRPPALQLKSGGSASYRDGDKGSEPETPFKTARMQMWNIHSDNEQQQGMDVTMDDVEPPKTPFRSTAAELDPVCTPTASTAASAASPLSESTLRTPSARPSGSTALPDHVHERARPYSTSRLPRVVDPPQRTSSPSNSSVLMSPSLSVGGGANRFSFGGAAAALSSSASGAKSRPDSMQSTMSTAASSTALFGVTALSREERKKQHRRTFSSDWPALQAGLTGPRRASKVDSLMLSFLPTPTPPPQTHANVNDTDYEMDD